MNSFKTEFILKGSKQRLTKCETDNININGEPIQLSKCIKYLGTWSDSQLSFKTHINFKCRMAWWNLQKLKLIRHTLTREAAHTIVLGLIISHLDFANSLLIGLPDCDINQMQNVQNAMARLVVQGETLTTEGCLKELHWLPVKFRIVFKVAVLMYRCLIDMAPTYLQDLIALSPNRKQGIRSNSDYKRLLVPCVSRQTFAARSFSMMGPSTWNNLPTNIRSSTSLEHFKKNLKTVLFLKAYA